MPWNLPEHKQSSPKSVSAGRPFWQQLNCFENGRFHAGRFAILLALLLMLIGGIKSWQAHHAETGSVAQGGKS